MNTEAPKLIDNIDTKKDKNVDESELTEFLVLKNTTTTKESKNTFVNLLNTQKETIKKLPGFTDSLEKVATEIAEKLKINWEIQDKITLNDKTPLTKNECAKILQVYAAIILDKNLTTTGQTYKKWTDVLFDFESKHTFGPQMNAIIDTLTNNTNSTNTDVKTKGIVEAYNTAQLNKARTTATKKIDNLYPESDGYNIAIINKINTIKTDWLDAIKSMQSDNSTQIIDNIIAQIDGIITPLLTEKKQQTKNILTKNAMHIQSKYTPDKIQNIGKKVQEQIDKAKTPAEINKIMADAQNEIKNIPTKYQEKLDEQNLAQKESDSNLFTYEKVGKEWKVSKLTEVDIPLIQWKNGWASMLITKHISTKMPTELKDESINLNTFMNLNSKKENIFSTKNNNITEYITKNYPSLSKNNEISNQINSHIKNYLKEKEKNHKPNIDLYGKDLTDVSLEIDKTTGEYYFNIPAEGNFWTNYPQPKITTLHLGINGEVSEYDETKNPDPILASIYTKGTLAYTLTHNTYNNEFSDLPGHIIPGTYEDKKNLLIIEAITSAKNDNITDRTQNYNILTAEKNKIIIDATAKSGKSAKEGTITLTQQPDGNISSSWSDKASTEVTSAKETTEENDSKEVYPTSQKDIENIINLNNNNII